MSTPEHSPLPWSTIKGTITDADENYVNTDFLSNRLLIVSAVNSHAALLAATKAVRFGMDSDSSNDLSIWRDLQAAIAAAEESAP